MSGIAEIKSTLVGSLVGSVLEGDDSVSGSQLLLRELAFILFSFLGSNGRLAILGCLTTESLEADDDRVEILPLPQVDGLEELLRWHAECLGRFQERVNVFHTLEGHFALLNALDDARLHNIGQFAQESSITQVLVNVIGISGGVVRFTGQLTDPFEYFLSVLLAVFAIDLWITRTKKKNH